MICFMHTKLLTPGHPRQTFNARVKSNLTLRSEFKNHSECAFYLPYIPKKERERSSMITGKLP